MSERLPVGPYKDLPLDDHTTVPWYMIPFDRNGTCTAPLTREHLTSAAAQGTFTDVFLFCHGWNNDWPQATSRYEAFFETFHALRTKYGLTVPRPYRPLLVGLFWPSTVLVMPSEQRPSMAGYEPEGEDREADIALERDEVDVVAQELDTKNVERFYALAQVPDPPTDTQLREMAKLLQPLFERTVDDEVGGDAPNVDELVAAWRASGGTNSFDTDGQIGTLDGANIVGETTTGAPATAGVLSTIRDAIRFTTVWIMKDRAGRVGGRGGGPLLRDLLLAAGNARFHLVGHSYGCRALLSAICIEPLPRDVDSLLLLQAAISAECFSPNVGGQPGGYRTALDRVTQPIMTTYSVHDIPLHDVFHLVMRRHDDRAEIAIAGGDASAPDRAALGGWGPLGIDTQELRLPMAAPVAPYDLGGKHPRVLALNGDSFIAGHGDVVNSATAWALYCQVVGNGQP
jgi:hypothetical protein